MTCPVGCITAHAVPHGDSSPICAQRTLAMLKITAPTHSYEQVLDLQNMRLNASLRCCTLFPAAHTWRLMVLPACNIDTLTQQSLQPCDPPRHLFCSVASICLISIEPEEHNSIINQCTSFDAVRCQEAVQRQGHCCALVFLKHSTCSILQAS